MKELINKNWKKKVIKFDRKKDVIRIITCFSIICIVVIVFSNVYGADPQLVNKLNSALKKIQGYFLKLAAPAAGVAIATGVMIRKLSFGDEEKMVLGKKVIVNAIICYGIVISSDLIIKFVEAVLK